MTDGALPPLPPATRRTILLYSVLCGLCPLIPLPLLDDWAQALLARRMARALLTEAGLPAPRAALLHLTRERAGCGPGFLLAPVLWPIRKLLRKVLFFLSFKACVDVAVAWLHRGWLLGRVLQRRELHAAALVPASGVWPVVLAMEEALQGTRKKPITAIVRRTFRGSRRLLLGLAGRLARALGGSRREEEAAEQAVSALQAREADLLDGLLATLEAEVWADADYWAAIEARYVERRAAHSSGMGPGP